MSITIVGNGFFGKAIHHVLQTNTPDIHVAEKGEPIEGEIVVLCAPTNAIRSILPHIQFTGEKKIIINTSKGIEESTHQFPYQIVHDYFGDSVEYYSLVGPGFAAEILADSPTFVNLGYYKNASHAEEIKNLFETPYFRIRLVQGVESLEIASAMKNIYAIGCGISDGLGYGDNTKVTLLTIAIDEMQHYFTDFAQSFSIEATAGMIGDLILTCMSKESRNYQFGKHVVFHTTEEALAEVKSTVEGYTSIRSLPFMQERSAQKLRLADFIANVIDKEEPEIRAAFADFLTKV